MAYWSKNNAPEEENKDLIYDLRQIYANDLVGATLREISFARKTNNFPLWFRLLKRDLVTEVNQKLDKEERKILNKKIEVTKKILFNNQEEYLGKSNDSEKHELVEDTLIELEKHIRDLMEEHTMFGAKDTEEALF